MSAEIIQLATVKRRPRRAQAPKRRQPEPVDVSPPEFAWTAWQALHTLDRVGEEGMADDRSRDLVRRLLSDAGDQLQRSLAAYTEAQRRDFRRTVVDAFGPDVRCGELNGARAMLELILGALPPRRV